MSGNPVNRELEVTFMDPRTSELLRPWRVSGGGQNDGQLLVVSQFKFRSPDMADDHSRERARGLSVSAGFPT